MPRVQIPFGKGSNQSEARPFSSQRCVNLFAALPTAESLSEQALLTTPGMTQFATTGLNPARGSQVMNQQLYVVAGSALFHISSAGAATSKGAISGAGRVSMANNGEKLCIVVPGGTCYVYNRTTDTLVTITDADFGAGSSDPGKADCVVFKDGYYIFTATAGDVFWNSALNDPLSYDALDFGTAEIKPDRIICAHVNHNELYILGEVTIELFQNVGGAGFPFQRVQGGMIQKGTSSKFSSIEFQGAFYFLGGGENELTGAYRVINQGVEKVSTSPIDREFQRFTKEEIAAAFGFSFSYRGHAFVGWTIESQSISSRTLIFNFTASEISGELVWFEMQTGLFYDRWRASTVELVYGKLLATDLVDGRIGELSDEVFTEYGEEILREKILPPISNQGFPFFVDEFELVCEAGIGLITGEYVDPLVTLSWSDDGTRTWSSEFERSMGKIGDYKRKVIWRRLGRCPQNRVFRLRSSAPVSTDFFGAWASIQGG